MSLKDVLKAASHPAVLIGVGLVAASPVLLKFGRGRGRNMVKQLVRKSMDLAEHVTETAAETQEKWNDLVAEVQAERESEREFASDDLEHAGTPAGEYQT